MDLKMIPASDLMPGDRFRTNRPGQFAKHTAAEVWDDREDSGEFTITVVAVRDDAQVYNTFILPYAECVMLFERVA